MAGGLLARSFGLLAPYWLSVLAMLALAVALGATINNRSLAEARRAADDIAAFGVTVFLHGQAGITQNPSGRRTKALRG